MTITGNITIEELVSGVPGAVEFLSARGIRCIRCGEPIWGTLEEAVKEKGFSESDLEEILKDLNQLNMHD